MQEQLISPVINIAHQMNLLWKEHSGVMPRPRAYAFQLNRNLEKVIHFEMLSFQVCVKASTTIYFNFPGKQLH